MSAAKRRKRKFTLKPAHVLLLLAVFSISVATTTTVASRMSQLAVGNEADMKCTPDKDYSCECFQPCPKEKPKKIGGKNCECTDMTNGHPTPGKCQAPNVCKGEAKGDGKAPEMPKMPEPPKGEPPKDSPPPPPCSANGTGSTGGTGSDNSFGAVRSVEGATSSKTEASQPCPGAGGNPISNFIDGILGGNTSTTSTSTATTTATTTKPRFSWTAVARVVQNAANAVTNVVTGAVQTAITTIGGNQTPSARPPDVVKYGGGSTTSDTGGSVSAKYFTSPQLNTFGSPVTAGQAVKENPPQSGFWSSIAQVLTSFLDKLQGR